MKKLLSASIAAAAIAGASAPAMAVEGLSANAGLASEYVFRGVTLGDASAFVGLDYEIAGFYMGTWATQDAGNGLEHDTYLGYALETESTFGFNVGLTRYDYTYTHDYEAEINLGFSIAGFAIDAAWGKDSDGTNIDDNGNKTDDAVTADYTFIALSWSGEVFGVTAGSYDKDNEKKSGKQSSHAGKKYKYVELSAGGEVGGIDTAVVIGRRFDGEESRIGSPTTSESSYGDDYIVVSASKSFDL